MEDREERWLTSSPYLKKGGNRKIDETWIVPLFRWRAIELFQVQEYDSSIIEGNRKQSKVWRFFSSIKESSHEHRFISYDSQGKRGMHAFECSLRDTLALRVSGSQDRYFANLNNIRPTKLSREVDIFKFITEPLPLNTAWYVPRPVLWFFVLFFFFFFPLVLQE